MISEDLAGQSITMAQKSAEIALEIARLLKEIYKSHAAKKREKVAMRQADDDYGKVDLKSGEVKLSQLKNSGYSVLMQPNIAAHDMEAITAKAESYDIPVSFIGKGENAENVTLAFKADDKATVNQILQEVINDKLTVKPDDYLTFEINNLGEAQTLSAMLKEQDIPADIIKNTSGKYQCLYEAKNATAVNIIKNDFKEIHADIAQNFDIVAEHSGIAADVPETERMTEIKARIDELKNAEIGSDLRSETYDNLLSDMRDKGVEFPAYSENNNKIIEREMPEAKQMAGKAFWEQQGYKLNEDAKGIEIVAPQMDDDGNPVLDENGKQTFTTTTVYDISETNAYEKTVDVDIDRLQSEYAAEKANAFPKGEGDVITGYVITDKNSDKSLTLTAMPTKEQLMKVLRSPKQFGYSENKAMEAANKFESTLSADKLEYFRTDTRQAALLNSFERNIKLKDESLLVKPFTFAMTNFSSENVNRYIISNGDKAIALTPDRMSRTEMAEAVRYKLGVSDTDTINAIVEKTEKIEVAHKVAEIKKEADISRQNGDIGIERRSEKFVEISQGSLKKSYDLTDKKQIKVLQNDFGISAEKAERIFKKAQNQSILQNSFHRRIQSYAR